MNSEPGESAPRAVAVQLNERWAGAAGYTSVVLDTAAGSVTVYWNGPVPESLTAQLSAARARGVRVVVSRARFSAEAMQREAARIADAFPAVRVVSPRADGSGLDVEVAPGTALDPERLSHLPVTITGEAEPTVL